MSVCSDQIYNSQIWHKSQCREIESSTYKFFWENAQGMQIKLVDAVHVPTLNNIVITDNIVNRPHFALYPEFWGSYSYSSEYVHRAPTKLFNCFMHRICSMRQSWFYQFVRKDLLDKGSVSFLLDYTIVGPPPGVNSKQELNDHLFEQQNRIFEVEHRLMRDRVPFSNFEGDLDQVMVDSHISLVIETYFSWPDTIAFSEKTFRALQLPRPLMIYCMPGSIKALRDHGFDVWDDVIDHNYDNETNEIQRQILILDQLCKLKDISYTEQQLTQFESRAEHNRQLLQNLKAQWPNKLTTVLSQVSNHNQE